ncbi:MAG: uroporphyrinogen decarboxylase [Methylovirgula sp.]|uniref:uroporphyrinogen decarboxylase n=1 Tax=Methylovirgula sp. TaxID=1978224 RepID=UPI00307663A3
MAANKPLLRVLNGEALSTTPVWLMRQAGRYLTEYKQTRLKARSFLDLCYNPKLAAEVTLQPIRRFHFDAAIIFSDILVVPDAFGQKVDFESGEGPRLQPIIGADDLKALRETIDLDHLSPVFEAIQLVKQALPAKTALIGFCGAPWTVASYMIAGRGTPDQAPARLFAYRNPDIFAALIERLIEGSVVYLSRQIEAGADCIQIFDSWAGALAPAEFERWALDPVRRIIAALRIRHPRTKIIAFPRGAGLALAGYAAQTGTDALGLDTSVDPASAAAVIPSNVVLQGNLDPLALIAGGEPLGEAVAKIQAGFRGRPHIFNLGHGILPETPLDNVEALLALLRPEA